MERKYSFGDEIGPFVPDYDEDLPRRVVERKRRDRLKRITSFFAV